MTRTSARGVASSAGLLLAIYLAAPLAAFAQIEEIVVTTRKREESLQDVPIAVSAITSEQIERQGISDLKDIVQSQPSVKFDQSFGPADNRITIRGLSNTRGRSNVAFLVDGIDVTTETLISAGSGLLVNRRLLSDVQRVEIVKGPQSALYGRAAFAGAISYVTKEPGEEWEGRVGSDLADFGKRNFDFGIGGPVTDTLGVRFNAQRWNEDGFYVNSVSGEDVGGSEGYGTTLTTVWKPEEGIKIKGRLEYSEERADPRAVANVLGDTPVFIPNGQGMFVGMLNGDAREIAKPIITGGAPGNPQPAASTANNLFNFGTYCPGLRQSASATDPYAVVNSGAPGFCLPKLISDSSKYTVAQSEDPQTGKDYPGTRIESFRASLVSNVDLGYGAFSSYTGWTDFDSRDRYDQDYQALARPDRLKGAQQSDQTSSTRQFSQEFRFETNFDGPLKYTAGLLYWDEERQLIDRNWITACSEYYRITEFNRVVGQPGVNGNPDGPQQLRDPNNGNALVFIGTGPSALEVTDPTTGRVVRVQPNTVQSGVCDGEKNSLRSWQEYRLSIDNRPNEDGVTIGQTPGFWEARTRHWSIYGAVEWQVTDEFKATFEDRFVSERFHLLKPGGSNCSEIAVARPGGPQAPWAPPIPGINPADVEDGVCDIDAVIYAASLAPDGVFPGRDPGNNLLTWGLIEGSTNSYFNTPKLTLQWQPSDQTNLFFSYAFAQKPGGINQLTGGGGAAPPPIEAERFDPEKLKAYELGIKQRFEAAGSWAVNASVFLQDYTDKQVSIQVISDAGISQPRVVNASGAEVWGLEWESTWQPSFIDGLTLRLDGTILDAKYTSWVDDTRNLVRVADYGSCPLVWKGSPQTFGTQVEATDRNATAIVNNPSDVRNGTSQVISRDFRSQVFCRLDYSGNDLERTPEQSYSASASLRRPFLDTPYEYLFEVSGSWQSERWAEPENLVEFDGYALMDMRFGLISDRWEVVGYVDNVLDDDTVKSGGSGPDFGNQVTELGFTAGFGTTHYFANMPDPRVFGIRAKYSFGADR